MTPAQQKKLNALKAQGKLINFYESKAGYVVVDCHYGNSYFMRFFIGRCGGTTTSTSTVYKHYDFEDKQPYGKIFQIN